MKLEMQMTNRDKKLLLYLGIFVIIVCFGWWGIRPSIKNIRQTNADIEKATEEKQIIDLKLAELPMLEFENNELEEEINNIRADYYPVMTSNEVDKMLTGMVLDYNLYAYDLDIQMPDGNAVLTAYKNSAKYESDKEYEIQMQYMDAEAEMTEVNEDTFDTYMYGDNSNVTTDSNLTGIECVSVSMRVGGEVKDLQKLINDLSNINEKLRVVNYSWNSVDDVTYSEELEDYRIEKKYSLNIGIELYMCED